MFLIRSQKKFNRIENGTSAKWLENLQGPNGVLFYKDNLYVLDNGGMYKNRER